MSLVRLRRSWKLMVQPARKCLPPTAAISAPRAVALSLPKTSFGGFRHTPGPRPSSLSRSDTAVAAAAAAFLRRCISTQTTTEKQIDDHHGGGGGDGDQTTDDEGWEEEEGDAEPEIGDGGDGGGVALRGVGWGERALAIARDVLDQHFDTQDISIFAFKVSPKGYAYVRLDKLSHKYGCPSIEEIERFNLLYKDQLEESGKLGEIPDNLAVEVSSPGASRLFKVPDELERFKDIPMVVSYLEEDVDSKVFNKREGVFFLDSIGSGDDHCTWKLADVKENRVPSAKGRPLSKKRKEWRLTLPFVMIKRVTFYLSF